MLTIEPSRWTAYDDAALCASTAKLVASSAKLRADMAYDTAVDAAGLARAAVVAKKASKLATEAIYADKRMRVAYDEARAAAAQDRVARNFFRL